MNKYIYTDEKKCILVKIQATNSWYKAYTLYFEKKMNGDGGG